MEAPSGCHAIIAAPFSRKFSFKTTNSHSNRNVPMSESNRRGSAGGEEAAPRRISGSEDGDHAAYKIRIPPSPRSQARVLQYDCKDNSARILKPAGKGPLSAPTHRLTFQELPDLTDTMVVDLPSNRPKKMKEVALFVDADTQQYVSTSPDYHQKSNLLLAKIHLERLHAKSRHIHQLRQVYVRNISSLFALQE